MVMPDLPLSPLVLALDAIYGLNRPVEFADLLGMPFFSMMAAFIEVDSTLVTLASGEIDVEQGRPIMPDFDGTYYEALPAMRSWCDYFEVLSRRLNLPIDLGPMRRLINKLDHGMLLDESDLERVRRVVDRGRALSLAATPAERQHTLQTRLIAIELENLGLIR